MFLRTQAHIIFCILLLNLFGPAANSQNIDIDILRTINPQDPTSKFWQGVSDSYIFVSGTAALGPLVVGLIKKDKDLQHKACETILAIGINIVATDILKTTVNRTRPADEYPNDVYAVTVSNGHSFPSGHTSLAFATATSLTLAYKKWYIAAPAYLWAGCVGYSRMYLGKHYPSDVFVGAVVGTGSAFLSHWLSQKLFRPKQINTNQ